MDVFVILVTNIIPLYILVGLGYISGRWLDVNLESMAKVAIYIIAPIVVFGAIVQLDFNVSYLLLPLAGLAIPTLITLIVYPLAKAFWKDNAANLIATGCTGGNTGYFGLPIVLALYGPEWAGVYLFMNFGIQIAEVTYGYFLAARGVHTVQESVKKVFQLPVLHALYIAVAVNLSGFNLPDVFFKYWTYATGAWVFIGMMIIGIAIGKLSKLELSWRLTLWLFVEKFVFWPLLGAAFILLDKAVFHAFSNDVHGLILIITSVPLMGNLVAFAANLKLHPERAATVVLLSTFFAIIYMPVLFFMADYWGLVDF